MALSQQDFKYMRMFIKRKFEKTFNYSKIPKLYIKIYCLTIFIFMCQNCHSKQDQAYPEKKYRLADFFGMWWEDYTKSPEHFITPEQYKAVNAILVCRTPVLGVDHYACKECGEVTEIYHSCKNRFCPTCSWQDTVKWAEKTKNKMMDLSHRHIVTTLPHQFNGLIKKNDKKLLDILMRVSADVFKDWIGNRYTLKPGIISVLHTYGETKNYHVHAHMIVSWGGIHIKTKKLVSITDKFVNYPFLQKKFRNKFEDELTKLYDNGALNHDFKNRSEFLKFLKKVNEKSWRINLEPPMEIPTQVVRYIGRYSKRACLSEYKITNIQGEYISFKYKDYKDKDENGKPIEKELTLHYREFFPRLLQHVPLKYFKIVRYYGAYANKASIPEEFLYKEKAESDTTQEQDSYQDPLICTGCGQTKQYMYTIIEKKDAYKFIFINPYLTEREKNIKRKKNVA